MFARRPGNSARCGDRDVAAKTSEIDEPYEGELMDFISRMLDRDKPESADRGGAGTTTAAPADYIADLATRVKGAKQWESQVPRSIDAAKSALMPKLSPPAVVLNLRMLYINEKKGDPWYAAEPFTEGLLLTVVCETNGHTYPVTQHDLDRWKVSLAEVRAIAERNLRARTRPDFCCTTLIEGRAMDLLAGTYGSSDTDRYNATRIILTDVIRKYPVNGDYVALIPQDGVLTFFGSEHGLGRMMKATRMASLLKDFLSNARFMVSPVPLRLVGDRWIAEEYAATDFDLPQLSKFYTMGMYAMQGAALQQLHENAGVATKIQQLGGHQDATGKIGYFTTEWHDEGPVLLPAVSHIEFKGKDSALCAAASTPSNWEKVLKVAGHRLTRLDLYPIRYLAQGFPSIEELKEIARM
jgi:hypothetical protein